MRKRKREREREREKAESGEKSVDTPLTGNSFEELVARPLQLDDSFAVHRAAAVETQHRVEAIAVVSGHYYTGAIGE